jgi:DNA polymerase-1
MPIGLGLKPVGYTDSGMPSTKWKVIKPVVSDTPLGQPSRYHNLLGVMLSRYLEPAHKWLGYDGRGRSTYSQHNVVTGRLSSSGPNLQNIPTPEKEPGTLLESHPIKNIFTYSFGEPWELDDFDDLPTDKAREEAIVRDHNAFMEAVLLGRCGCVMSADYANMEIRVMASVSNCQGYKKAFEDKLDIHSAVAELLYGVKQEDYAPAEWKAMRYRAKWVNWTLLYGGSYYTLMLTYGIPEAEAKWIEKTYYERFPEVLEYRKEQIAFAKQHGYVQSVYGRRRYLPYINDHDDSKRHQAEREGVNMPIQSAASDTLLIAQCIEDQLLLDSEWKSLMVNTVHDSTLFDTYPGELSNLYALVKDAMINVKEYSPIMFPNIDMSWLTVPLDADIEVGHHYGRIHSYGDN